MGIRTVFTDHSLFGFDDAASILTNKLMVGTLKNVDAVICVSHTGYVSLSINYSSSTDTQPLVAGKIQSLGVNFLSDQKKIQISSKFVRIYTLFRMRWLQNSSNRASNRQPIPVSPNISQLTKSLTVFLVTIVVLSRLAYRKGIDLLVATAPRICALFPNVNFVVGMFSFSQLQPFGFSLTAVYFFNIRRRWS